MVTATKSKKIGKKKWGHEENSSDISPKMKSAIRQQGKKEIDDNM
jgi:hypothetical protein